jgi:ABC-type sugar transport system ATPase subunit
VTTHTSTVDSAIAYSARGLTKRYGAITACEDVDIDIPRGEIVAIVGDNGAGKSTVLKIMVGAIQADSGELIKDGKTLNLASTLDAHNYGIEVVFQDLALCPNLDVAANIFLGRELSKRSRWLPLAKVLDRQAMRAQAESEIGRLKVNIPAISGVRVGKMSGGQRQCVAVARAIFWSRDVLFMDEPTAALGVKESGAVLELVKKARENGISVVMISHAMPHVMQLADRVIVMRHGHKVEEIEKQDVSMDRVVRAIVGD